MTKPPTHGPIGERIRWARRERAKITQRSVADHFGIAVPSVSEWESGTSEPKRDKIVALALLLKVDPLWLFAGIGGPDIEDIDKTGIVPFGHGGRAVPMVDAFSAINDLHKSVKDCSESAIPQFHDDKSELFCVRIDDESNADKYPRGSIAFILPTISASPGTLVFAAVARNKSEYPLIGQLITRREGDAIRQFVKPLNAAWAEEPVSRIVGTVEEVSIPTSQRRT